MRGEPHEDERGRRRDASASKRGGPVATIDEGLGSGDGVARVERRGEGVTRVAVPVPMCGRGLAEQVVDAAGGADVAHRVANTNEPWFSRGLTAVVESPSEGRSGRSSVSNHDFDSAVESYQQALDAFLKGDAGPVSEHFSRRDDVTLANPLGPPRVGRADVETAIGQASANFEDGYMRFEEISRYATDDLGYVVWIERGEVRLVGS